MCTKLQQTAEMNASYSLDDYKTQPLPLSISVSPQLVKQRERRGREEWEGFIAIRVIARENTSGLIAGCPLRPSVHIRPSL